MKLFIFFALALLSFSALATECEIQLVLSGDATHAILELTEKDKAQPDSEMVESIIGSKRGPSSCGELEKVLDSRGLKILIEDEETEVKVVNLSEKPVVPLLKD